MIFQPKCEALTSHFARPQLREIFKDKITLGVGGLSLHQTSTFARYSHLLSSSVNVLGRITKVKQEISPKAKTPAMVRRSDCPF